MTVRQEPLDLDNILLELGQFGRYQIRAYFFILLPILFSAIYNGQYVFAAGNLDYRCKVPLCEESTPVFESGTWAEWAYPEGGSTCTRLQEVGDSCAPDSFSETVVPCDDWVFHSNETIVAEFGLACQEWKRTLVGTINSAGLFAALPLTAYVSDTFGRRTAYVLTAVLAGTVGVVRSFSTGYIMYLVLEFLNATLGSGVYSTGFILALEMIGTQRRVLGGNLISCTFALGQVILALAAWRFPYWRTLFRVIYTPSLLFIFYFFILEESVRWLLSNGKKKEAIRIIYKVAKINDKKLKLETVRQLEEHDIKPSSEVASEEKKAEVSVLLQVLRSKKIMFRVAVCSFWWITVVLVYYGLSINSVSLAGNKYVNYILTSLVEIPGYAMSVLTLDRFGRRNSIMMAFYICGFSLIIMPFMPEHLLWLQTSLTMLGKLCISMAFSSIYIYTVELFPTSVRHRLLGFCSMLGRIGSLLAPQTPLLMKYMESLPYLLFGGMAGIAATLMLFTPETLKVHLPDTIYQAENIEDARKSTTTNPTE